MPKTPPNFRLRPPTRKQIKFTIPEKEQRPDSRKRGYTTAWNRARNGYLRRHPLCVKCEAKGRVTPADVVHHIISVRIAPELFWDKTNWESLCHPCHNLETGKERMGKPTRKTFPTH